MDSQVCKNFCTFYKPGRERKEQTKCGTYSFLERNLTVGEIRCISSQVTLSHGPQRGTPTDASIKKMVCKKCGFFREDCDFRQGLKSPPCGGYVIVEHLLKRWSH